MAVNSNIGKYNTVYKFIDDNSHLVSHASVAMAGGMTFGIYGAVIGLGVSVLDNYLQSTQYIKEKSNTQVFIGFTLGYNTYPSWVTGLIGAGGSALFSQGVLNAEVTSLLVPVVLGAKINGFSGAIVGATLGIADQVLLQINITNKHYFSCSLLGATSLSAIFGKSIFSNSAGAALGLMLAYHETINYSLPSIEVSKNLYKIYLKIIPQKQLEDYISEYSIILLSSQIITNQLRIIYLKHQQKSMYQFEHMNELGDKAISKLTMIAIKYTFFLFPYVTAELVSNILNNFYSTILYIKVDDTLREVLFTNETALKLSYDKNNTVITDNLKFDARVVSRDGSALISDSIMKSISGIYGISNIIVNVPEMLVYSTIYNKGKEYISNILSEQQSKYEVLIKKQESVISSLFKHDINNIKIITEIGGAEYSYNQLQFEYDKLREYELINDQILQVINAWRVFESTENLIFTYYLIGYGVGANLIDFDNRISMHYSCLQVSRLLAWNGEKLQEINTFYRSIERLNVFLNKTLSNENSGGDNIERKESHDNKVLALSNLDIVVANKHLIYIDYLELEFGKRYVISGPSGSGKSSLITKIVGTIKNNVEGEGSIFYPKNAKISLINQQDYFPLNKNMQEIIFYPKEVNQSKIGLVQRLLIKVGLGQYKLDQIEDWYVVFSGGQKQEAKIISAITQEPNILILDEVFSGLDKKSIELMQSIIAEELPNIMVIAIDHNVLENNSTGFYTNFLEVIDGELIDVQNKISHRRECNQYTDYVLFKEMINYDMKCYDSGYYE